jgi:heme/copper-type cytochrome/quinol oxidase subunit 2
MKISGVIGVIIITFIVIFVASLTYSQVESIREAQNKKTDQSIEGSITSIHKNTTIEIDGSLIPYWTVTLTDSSSENNMYHMIFEDTYPPLQNMPLRFYYRNVPKDDTTYLWITQIEQR